VVVRLVGVGRLAAARAGVVVAREDGAALHGEVPLGEARAADRAEFDHGSSYRADASRHTRDSSTGTSFPPDVLSATSAFRISPCLSTSSARECPSTSFRNSSA